MITAVIPAKSTSVRIPNKNIVDIGGKPLYQWTFDTCLALQLDRVVVATDSKEIKQACHKYNFDVFDLSQDDLEDRRTVRELWKVIANEYNGQHLLLQLPCPFRLVSEIKKAIQMQKNYDIVISVKTEHDALVDEFGKSTKDNLNRLSQKEKHGYYITAGFWISDSEYVKNSKGDLQEGNVLIFPVNPLSSIDINTPEDLYLARIIAEGLNTGRVSI